MLKRRDDDTDKPSAYDKALGLLTRREHSSRELKTKLTARGYEADEVTETLATLERSQYQSDARYAEVLARSRIAAGYGPRFIEAELRTHGIAPACVREQLAAEDWHARALQLVERRFRALDSERDRNRAAQLLMRRGFPGTAIREAIRRR